MAQSERSGKIRLFGVAARRADLDRRDRPSLDPARLPETKSEGAEPDGAFIGFGDQIGNLLDFARAPGATRAGIIESWNGWLAAARKRDPKFRPDLRGLRAEALPWRSTPLWSPRSGRLLLAGIDLSGCDLSNAQLGRARLQDADLRGADLRRADFTGARGLTGRNWRGADLTGTGFAFCDLSGGDFTGAILNKTDFTQADISDIRYANYTGLAPWLPLWPLRRNRMLGRYLGIKGVEASFGDPGFRRDAQDQDFIDDKYSDALLLIRRGWRASLEASAGKGWAGKRLGAVRWADLPLRLPKRLFFWFWSLTDYGRSVLNVTLIAALMVFGFSWLYDSYLIPHHHMAVDANYIGSPRAALYAAARGFANLGIDDILHARSRYGAIALFANQVSGYVFIGMLLAVLQNKFARRA